MSSPADAKYGSTSLGLEFGVDESVSNAVLWYQTETAGRGREEGRTITKAHLVPSRTTPTPLFIYFCSGDDLLSFVKKHLDGNAVRSVLYSKEGFDARMAVKRDVEARIERRSLWLCCCTCGLILCRFCCCCPGRNWEKDVNKLNEEHYCGQLNERYPDRTTESTYNFTTATTDQK